MRSAELVDLAYKWSPYWNEAEHESSWVDQEEV